ncbi:MAG TPA: glycosyltransferase [Chthoniobacterales bacterium]|nr:glycosyltransferase [Chthoniobacterales bacterium]
MKQSLRILGILDIPWDARLGGARVWMDLAEQWTKAGHTFERFSFTEAFPKPTTSGAIFALRRLIFPSRAARFVRNNASRFDVIDCLLGTLPFSKKRLGFDGLVVGRSIGLNRPYQNFIRFSKKRWPDQPHGKRMGGMFYDFVANRINRRAERALVTSDLVNLLNEDEKPFVPHDRVIVEPNGLTEVERAALHGASQPAARRLAQKEICFVGMWGLRKGSRDWPEIIRHIRSKSPATRFRFLGTMVDQATVLADLGISDGVRVVETFDRKELPELLGPCAVGLFPSYIEGFGLAVIEQLAGGIPVIAYDVPGPRQIFSSTASKFLVPAGNAAAMAERAVEILRMTESEYASLSETSRQIADRFRWEQIAADTIEEYATALTRLRGAGQHETGVVSA